MEEMEDRVRYILELLRNNLRRVLIAAVVLLTLLTAVKTIGPEEEGVVLSLGKYSRTLQPGLNFIMPWGIESLFKIPVQRQLKQEFGFRTSSSGVNSRYEEGDCRDESSMLTGDLNLADVEWVVQYRIVDSYKYLFRVRNSEMTFRDMSEAAMRKIVGDRTVNEILTVGRQEAASRVEMRLQEMCDEYENGIRVDQVVLQDVNPPELVKPSFNAVNEAQQERSTLINQAESKYNMVIPRARGEAMETVQLAEAYALNRVNGASGEADRFLAVYSEFIKAPEITRKRLYLETLERVLPKVGNKIIVDEKSNNVLPLLNMGDLNTAK